MSRAKFQDSWTQVETLAITWISELLRQATTVGEFYRSLDEHYSRPIPGPR